MITDYLEALEDRISKLYHSDKLAAKKLLDEQIEIARNNQSLVKLAHLYFLLAEFVQLLGKNDAASKTLNFLLDPDDPAIPNENLLPSYQLRHLHLFLHLNHNNQSSAQNLEQWKGIRILAEQQNEHDLHLLSLIQLAEIQKQSDDFERAEQNLLTAHELCQHTDQSENQAMVLIRMYDLYVRAGFPEEALQILKQAQDICLTNKLTYQKPLAEIEQKLSAHALQNAQ